MKKKKALLVFSHQLTENQEKELIEEYGVKEIEVHLGKDNLVETVTVNMGKPKLTSKLPELIFVIFL